MKIMRNVAAIYIVFFVSLLSSSAQDTLNLNKIEKGVDKYLSYFSGENPGAVVTVIKKENVLFHKAYGQKNIETDTKLEGNELFNLGELSKSFTAVAIFKLVEKGKLNLDQTITSIFPDFPAYGDSIRIQHLLDHKSGLANFNPQEVKSNDDVYAFLALQNKAIFEPGSKFIYSNSDYPLLVNIIEEISNKSYEEFLIKHVFRKLKMDHSYFIDEIANKNIAVSHVKKEDRYVAEMPTGIILGDRGIFMNATDYVKYDHALYINKLLDCESLQKIFRVEKLNNKENVSDYTCGWALMAKGGVRYFWHGGSQGGYSNLVLHLPDTQTTILILTNRNDGYDFLKMAIYIAKLFDKDLKL